MVIFDWTVLTVELVFDVAAKLMLLLLLLLVVVNAFIDDDGSAAVAAAAVGAADPWSAGIKLSWRMGGVFFIANLVLTMAAISDRIKSGTGGGGGTKEEGKGDDKRALLLSPLVFSKASSSAADLLLNGSAVGHRYSAPFLPTSPSDANTLFTCSTCTCVWGDLTF